MVLPHTYRSLIEVEVIILLFYSRRKEILPVRLHE